MTPVPAPPSTREDRTRVRLLIGASIAIGIAGAAASLHLLDIVPSNYEPICLQDPEYAYGVPSALNSAEIWLVVGVWAAFAAACCATWSRTKAWRVAAIGSAVGLFVEGTLFLFVMVLSQACQ